MVEIAAAGGWLLFQTPTIKGDDGAFLMAVVFLVVGLGGLGLWLLGRLGRKRPGVVIGAVLALLSVERFVVEFFRAKDDRFLGGFTLAQAFALGLFALGVGITVWRSRRKVA